MVDRAFEDPKAWRFMTDTWKLAAAASNEWRGMDRAHVSARRTTDTTSDQLALLHDSEGRDEEGEEDMDFDADEWWWWWWWWSRDAEDGDGDAAGMHSSVASGRASS